MPTPSDFPGDIDDFAISELNGVYMNAGAMLHGDRHEKEGDAITKLEEKVGADASADPNSLDYKASAADAHAAGGTHSAANITFNDVGLAHFIGANVQAAAAAADAAISVSGIPGTIFDAAGDLIEGTGNNTYARRALGAPNTVLAVNAAGTAHVDRDVYAIPQSYDTLQVDSFTVAVDQIGQIVPCEADDATARVITLPQQSDVAVAAGQAIFFEILGAVPWTWSAGAGATIEPVAGVSGDPSAAGGSIVVAMKRDTVGLNDWRVFGDILVAGSESEPGHPPIRVSPTFPSTIQAAYGFNGEGFSGSVEEESTPGTRRLWQVSVNAARHPMLNRRTTLSKNGALPSDWTQIDLTTKMTANGGLIDQDGHNFLSMHIDSDGYVHVLGNMHQSPVAGRYCVSRVPYSMTLADYVPALFETGATANTVMTYPQFVQCGNGTFILTYRDLSATGGVDHRANQYIKRYTPNGSAPPASGTNSRWGAAVKLFDGIDDPVKFGCVYLDRIVTDPRDRSTHWIFFLWRNNDPEPETAEKLGCIVTHDDFATFERADGTAITLPIDRTDYTGAMVVDNVAEQSISWFSSTGACVDWMPMNPVDATSGGRPHVSYRKGSPDTLYRSYWNGSAWVTEQLGNDRTLGSTDAALIANPQGEVFLIYTDDGRARIADVTPEKGMHADAVFMDFDYPLMQAPWGIPQQAQLDFNEAHFVFAQVGPQTDETAWETEAFVVHLDTTRLSDVASRRFAPITPIATASASIPGVGREVSVFSATVVDLDMARVRYPGGWCQARFVGFAKVVTLSSGTLEIHIGQEHPLSGTTAHQLGARVTVANTWTEVVTPWVPLRTLAFLSNGEVSVWAGLTSGGVNGLLRGQIQLQRLPVERI